jgi:hypothetical protein
LPTQTLSIMRQSGRRPGILLAPSGAPFGVRCLASSPADNSLGRTLGRLY